MGDDIMLSSAWAWRTPKSELTPSHQGGAPFRFPIASSDLVPLPGSFPWTPGTLVRKPWPVRLVD